MHGYWVQFSHVQLFATPWTAGHQTFLSITNSQSLLKLMSIESVMPSNHLILCCPLLLPSILPSIRVFSSESVLRIRWPKYWRFSFSISPSNEYSGLISFRMDWLDLLAVQRDSQKSSPTPQFKSISSSMLSFLYSPNFTSVHGCQMQDNLSIFIWRSHISFTTAKWHRNHCPCQALYIDNYARIFSLVIPCMLSK